MGTNFQAFSKEMKTFGEELLPEQFILFQKKIVFQLLGKVVHKTPVDTGRARGNWQVGIDQIPFGEVDKADPDGGSTAEQGLVKLAGLQPGKYQTVYIANSVPYIIPLENGHSQQAPAGMLALSVAEIDTQFQ